MIRTHTTWVVTGMASVVTAELYAVSQFISVAMRAVHLATCFEAAVSVFVALRFPYPASVALFDLAPKALFGRLASRPFHAFEADASIGTKTTTKPAGFIGSCSV